MLSQTLEYALRAVAFLAQAGAQARTAQEIAEATRVPANYLAKVLGQLARAGVVSSQRGLGGGFALARPAGDLSILEVAAAVDPIQRITGCPLDLPEHANALCALHSRLDGALASIEASFRSSCVADLVAAPAGRGGPPAWPSKPSASAARARAPSRKKSAQTGRIRPTPQRRSR
jgi:Rrf2 family protein